MNLPVLPSSKSAARRSINCQSDCADGTDEVSQNISCRVVLIEGERPGEGFAVRAQRHFFANVRHAYKVAIRVPTDWEVVELVSPGRYLLPHSQAETLGDRRPRGVQDFGSIAVPLGKPLIQNGSIGRSGVVAFGSQSDLPKPDDGISSVGNLQ